MITCTVTAAREALVPIEIEGPTGERIAAQAAIDTGFTDCLVVPPRLARQLELPSAGAKTIVLGDGGETTVPLCVALGHWHGQALHVPVLETDAGVLIGMALLQGSRLAITVVPNGEVTIEPL